MRRIKSDSAHFMTMMNVPYKNRRISLISNHPADHPTDPAVAVAEEEKEQKPAATLDHSPAAAADTEAQAPNPVLVIVVEVLDPIAWMLRYFVVGCFVVDGFLGANCLDLCLRVRVVRPSWMKVDLPNLRDYLSSEGRVVPIVFLKLVDPMMQVVRMVAVAWHQFLLFWLRRWRLWIVIS
jgi:hypothetical protein